MYTERQALHNYDIQSRRCPLEPRSVPTDPNDAPGLTRYTRRLTQGSGPHTSVTEPSPNLDTLIDTTGNL